MKKLLASLILTLMPVSALASGVNIDGITIGKYFVEVAITANWRIDKLTCRLYDKNNKVIATEYSYNLDMGEWDTLLFYVYERGIPDHVKCK